MKNTLLDLNNHLFAQLERLGDEDLTKDGLEIELQRSKAITSVSNSVINNASLMLQARKHIDEVGNKAEEYPAVLGITKNANKK